MPRSCEWSLPFRFSDLNFVRIFHLSHACYMPRPTHPPRFDHPNNTWWSVNVMKPLIMQSCQASRYFLPLRSKHSPQLPVLKCPQFVLSLVWETKFHTHIKQRVKFKCHFTCPYKWDVHVAWPLQTVSFMKHIYIHHFTLSHNSSHVQVSGILLFCGTLLATFLRRVTVWILKHKEGVVYSGIRKFKSKLCNYIGVSSPCGDRGK
jgi:hypothetical protein